MNYGPGSPGLFIYIIIAMKDVVATKFLVSVGEKGSQSKMYWVRVNHTHPYTNDQARYDRAHFLAKKEFVKNHPKADMKDLYSVIVKTTGVTR